MSGQAMQCSKLMKRWSSVVSERKWRSADQVSPSLLELDYQTDNAGSDNSPRSAQIPSGQVCASALSFASGGRAGECRTIIITRSPYSDHDHRTGCGSLDGC